MIFIGSVSAVDDTIDKNLTADDSSLEISGLKEGRGIDETVMEDSDVDVK